MKRTTPLVLAIALFFAVAALWIVGDRRASERIYDAFSSASTADNGLSLASGYLAKHRKVSMLTRPLGHAGLERNAVVFRVTAQIPTVFDPEDLDDKKFGPPKPKRHPLLTDAEETFVRHGGRIIVASPEALPDTKDLGSAEVVKKVFPLWPRVGDLALEDDDECKCGSGWSQLPPRMHTIFAAGAATILARQRHGDGELFVLSLPHLLTNEQLVKPNRLELLHALAGERRPVYFDEVPHGILGDDGVLTMLKEWNLGPFLLLILAIAALVFWRAGRRIGPPEDDHRETRSDAIDLVRSLGALYDEATSNAAAIALYHDVLTRTVASQTGLRGDALRKRVDTMTKGFVPPAKYEDISAATFRQQLEIMNAAFSLVRSSVGPLVRSSATDQRTNRPTDQPTTGVSR